MLLGSSKIVFFAVEEIEARMMKKCYMKIHVAVCPAADKVLIKNLRNNVDDEALTLYFESRRMCPCGSDVASVKMYDSNKSAVVQFQDCSGMWLVYVSDICIS